MSAENPSMVSRVLVATDRSETAEVAVRFASEMANRFGTVVVGEDPAKAIIDAAETENVDIVVVGNVGMSGRKEFLLGNVPNRVSHGTRRTVVIVNTMQRVEEQAQKRRRFFR